MITSPFVLVAPLATSGRGGEEWTARVDDGVEAFPKEVVEYHVGVQCLDIF